ncbi:outer membrane lipoprotein-sorting protein [Chitinophaga barathri]|uniref:Outer membrane lipoprotein-sorting protein n=1 Tax=Chitinophaga barathri TaxID=1647451 RepID=A0A3N4M6Y4_9BACT|nr:outer membrane lipoprotein-sorting protein [Chitinophaga barathri]RPD39061.1 outer membrane lipoprotein-sorting protein [Chitinophaga barathri]
MKNFLMLTLAVTLTGTAVSTKAQTVDEIVEKHITAMGGKDKLAAIKSTTTEGTMEVQGMEFPFKATIINKRGMRIEFEAMGTKNVQVATTTGGWNLLGVQQQTEPVDVPAESLKEIGPDLDIEGELVNAKEKGHTLELIGKEPIDGGAELYKIKLTRKDGNVANYFIDTKTYYITKRSANMGGEEAINSLLDYKKTDDGYAYATVVETQPTGVKVKVNKITFNPPVDEKIFDKPAK